MRVFKSKKFAKFASKERLADSKLCAVVKDMENGIIHTDLGGNVYKQRVARKGQGKSGGYRVIVLYKIGALVFFVHGFLKAAKDNITEKQEDMFKELAGIYLKLSTEQLEQMIALKEITEVICHEKE